MNPDIAQILDVASDTLRSQFKREFIARIDIALHNQRLAEVNKAVADFFTANLVDTHHTLITTFKEWVTRNMRLVYRRHLQSNTAAVQLFRKNYFGSANGDVYVCCAEVARVVFYAYNIEVEKLDQQGFVEVTINKELGNTIFIFA